MLWVVAYLKANGSNGVRERKIEKIQSQHMGVLVKLTLETFKNSGKWLLEILNSEKT